MGNNNTAPNDNNKAHASVLNVPTGRGIERPANQVIQPYSPRHAQ